MQLDHIAIICSHVKSIEFYNLLGFIIVKRLTRPQQHDEIVWMNGNGITLELFIDETHPQRPTNPEANGLRHLAFVVEDLEKTYDLLREYNPEFIRTDPSTGERLFFVKDPDGLPIEFRTKI